jgi:para-nitrobenzyl esterase
MSAPRSRAVVDTSAGLVRGRDGSTFLGVPYAAPPVGARRWAPPAPVGPWAGEYDATSFGPPPPQPHRPIADFAWGLIPPGDEDCLYLNVWRPRFGDGPWPVLVFVIGGGFTIGWTGSGVDDGAALADAAQVVVVTFSYRLGSLGWAHGNWGLRDVVAVLEWVAREIGAFGGDPGAVTLGGQSAGAACVADLLVSPAAEGLFARALLHSPPLPEAAQPAERRAEWDAALGHDRAAPADAVVARHEALLREPAWAGTRGAALPTLEDGLLPVSPLDDPAARLDVPVLVGTTRDEATFLLRTGGREASDEQVERLTAHLFHGPSERWARERAAAGGRVHVFRIDHRSPDPRLGALHTIDVPLLFGTTGEVARHYIADDERTREVSRAMQRDWGRFIHGEELEWGRGEPHVIGQDP